MPPDLKRPANLQQIPGFEGRYSVTADGRIWSHLRKRWLHTQVRKHGYVAVMLTSRTGIRRMHYVHRFVLLVWGPPKPSLAHMVNHKDLNKQNNHIENLEWVTNEENIAHAIANSTTYGRHTSPCLRGSDNPAAKLTEEQVLEIRIRLSSESLGAIAREFDVSRPVIASIRDRKTWRHI